MCNPLFLLRPGLRENFRARLLLNAEELRNQDGLVRWDAPGAEDFRRLDAVLLRDEVIGGAVPETLAHVAVDARHHQADVLLREVVKRGRQEVVRPFRKNGTDELVVALGARLLTGGAGVGAEEVRDAVALAVELDGLGVGEFGAVVRDGHEEHLAHNCQSHVLAGSAHEPVADQREGRIDVRRRLCVEEERRHESVRREHERRQDLAALGALDRIHLCEGEPGALDDGPLAVIPCAPDAALRIDLVFD